jgi:Carbohydrate binding module (family 6)
MTRWRRLTTTITLTAALTAALLGLNPVQQVSEADAVTYEGYGSATKGGAGQAVYRVTNLNNSGTGSLRDAVAKGYRYIVFDVAGEIKLSSDIYVKGPFLTIDGTTAPSPGITMRYAGLMIRGNLGAHDIIVRGIRSRASQGCDDCNTSGAGFSIGESAYNIVLDHVSAQGAQDQALGMGSYAHDITVQYSIFAESKSATGKNLPVLIGSSTQRVSFHHNLIVKGYERMPQVVYSSSGKQSPDTQIDLRNNLLWDWNSMATTVWKGARANIVGNYYYDPDAGENGKKRAIYFCTAKSVEPQCSGNDPALYARAYIAGNVSGHGPTYTDYLNRLSSESGPFPAAKVTTTDACTAAQQVRATAGVRPLDSVDQTYLNKITLVGCTAPASTPSVDSVDLEAEDFDSKSSNVWLTAGQGEGGGDAIGMNHNAWTAYNAVDFDGLKSVSVRVASGNQGGTISVRLGSTTGPVLGSLSFANTGGWDKWVTRTAALKPAAGTQTLYLTFVNAATGGGQMMLFDRFELMP